MGAEGVLAMTYSRFPLLLIVLLALIISIKSQSEQGICYELENCGGETNSSGLVDSVEDYCCTYSTSGEVKGYSYRIGSSLTQCMACPLVFGFYRRDYFGSEQSSPHSLQLGYISGRPPTTTVRANVAVTTGNGPHNASLNNDFTITNAADGTGIFTLIGQNFTSVSVQHTIDGISQENHETYFLSVSNNLNLQNFRFEGITVTIVDNDTVRFFFGEADHSKNEGSDDLMIVAQLSKNIDSRLANPVTFMITPLTIQEANRSGINIPSAARLEQNPKSPYEAVEADFNSASFEVIFPADEKNDSIASIDVNVGIVNDNINERNEQLFLISMKPMNFVNEALLNTTERNVTIGIIVDNDLMVIGFDQSEFSVDEPQNEERREIHLVKLQNRPTEQTFDIQVNLQDYTLNQHTATINEDYNISGYNDTSLSDRFVLQSNQDIVTLNLTLLPDNKPEGIEGFILEISPFGDPIFTLPSSSTPALSRQMIVEIRDDDPFIIGFEEPVYRVNESESVMICIVVIDPPINLAFSVLQPYLLIGSPRSGSASGSDYNIPGNQLFYGLNSAGPNVIQSRRSCGRFFANADEFIEGTEDLQLQLEFFLTTPEERVILEPARTTVEIIDQSVVVVGFIGDPYVVSESNGTATVTIGVINGTLGINVSLAVELQSGSATAPSDYLPSLSTSTITLSQASPTATVNFPIVDDSVFEPTENLFAELSFAGSSHSQVILNPSRAQINIVDNDLSGTRVNDTVIGDPLYTVPIRVPQEQLDALSLTKLSLCYEIHGKPGQWFNLVTDNCVSVNTRYASLTRRLNFMDSVAVRAVDEANQCVNIRVDVDQCSAMVGGSSLAVLSKYESNGIMVKRYSNRVRITVPNCQDLTLVMWVICEDRTLENPDQPETFLTSRMIKFVVMRGLNFGSRQAHGLLGQFWNVPVSITPYNGLIYGETPAVGWYIVNITTNGINRAYGGNLHTTTWDNTEGPCLFVGNRQSGPTAEIKDPNDPVIQEIYTSYEVKEPFGEDDDYKFGMFDETRCNLN